MDCDMPALTVVLNEPRVFAAKSRRDWMRLDNNDDDVEGIKVRVFFNAVNVHYRICSEVES